MARLVSALAGLGLTALVLAGCANNGAGLNTSARTSATSGEEPLGSSLAGTPTAVAAPNVAATASPSAAAGSYGSLPQGLLFSPAPGFTIPAWLPARIRLAPQAPSAATCGVDAQGVYRALVRFDPESTAGAVTVQVNDYRGPGTYTNAPGGTNVDIEVSPPRSDLTGLSGFEQLSSVTVAPDGVSGTLEASMLSADALAGRLAGTWRCG